ncbi:MAG: DUF1566 domain-containing protein [Deltaproteobacteria bacterium]|nr:DUF1566 domain-containing protein [Deltaproteobacteria bacterium]MBW2105521.1 DUF1566 domain-containing protein [Deltaproteobacteria bacterium]MBW2331962.1 DUF1566 domain-containing protein [Deltaproteobacteria bacterium]
MKRRKYYSIRALVFICIFCLSFTSTIVYSQGYDNVTVREAQKKLQKSGYDPGPIDGIWGKKTENTIKKFQYDNELPATGRLDSPTLKKMGLEERKGRIPVTSIQNQVKDALDYTWEIRKVVMKNRILTVIPNFDHINKKGYVSMIPWICIELCKYPHVINQLEEIRILNLNQNQGWVYVEPGKCDQIIHAPLNQVDEIIFSKTKEFDPYENRRKQISVKAKIQLRSKPTFLSPDNVKRMLIKYNFYSKCHKWSKGACNPKGNFQNDYVDNGNGTIIDRTTGLMWQKNSSHHMEGSDAQVYVDTLNRKRFLGLTDWRLPTIEELASLIESKKSSEGLHMAPLFSQGKESYWSSDKLEPNVLWCVNFYAGAVIPYFHKTWQNMVRAVR